MFLFYKRLCKNIAILYYKLSPETQKMDCDFL